MYPDIRTRVRSCKSSDRERITVNKFRGPDKRRENEQAGVVAAAGDQKSISYRAFFTPGLFYLDAFARAILYGTLHTSVSCFPHALIKIRSFPAPNRSEQS